MQNVPHKKLSKKTTNTGLDSDQREFAHRLAEAHINIKDIFSKATLLEDLKAWEKGLLKANSIFITMPIRNAAVSHAGEWMLDNSYIITQTFRQIDENLPLNFLAQLPALNETPYKGYPRIFAIAREWINYCNVQLEQTQITNFIQDYQQITPLTIGELWALPIMLRIGVLEKLVVSAAELTGMEKPEGLTGNPPHSIFADEAIVANSFLSLRLLSATDWKNIFEKTSHVEQVLSEDPAHVYADMDFDTRNSYRSVIEELARHSTFSEEEVARTAIELARDERIPGRKKHVGFYLRDNGRILLENRVHFKPGVRKSIHRTILAFPTIFYLGSIAIFSLLIVFGLLAYTKYSGGSILQLLIVGGIGLGLALEAAIALVNWNVTHKIRPRSLPRMDFSKGVPIGNRTMVVVPTLLESEKELNHLMQELEIYFLSNSDPQLTYALLTDFKDSVEEKRPEDEPLLKLANDGINTLNQKYNDTSPFYLFHRHRQWNPSEGVWMGWERKRGKLADFNRLLLNLGDTAYSTVIGDIEILTDIKYVITLDADTSLPNGSAIQLIATLAHPLNIAEFSADGCNVVAGYTVLQPRVAIKPTSANRSLFSQIFAGNAGFDLYSFAVSDVYQDLFGEGSYVGKGIYDVAAFERSLAGQVRQNTLLSHDLFEGIYGRSALVTNTVLYEEYPSRYLDYARRLHRWIRGDWQLIPWLLPFVNTKTGMVPNRLSIINQWKIFDNLRRSLLPLSMVTLFSAGWLYLPGSPYVWTLLAVLPSALPILMQTAQQVKHNSERFSLKATFESIRLPLTRWLLAILFLPYEAMLMLGAIITTLTRLIIERKNLLQWTTAAKNARSIGQNPMIEIIKEMAPSLLFTAILLCALVILNPLALWAGLPLLVAWLVAPIIAFKISQPLIHTTPPLSEPQRRQVLRLARRTWAFFEHFTGPNDQWLPPDHFQETPRGNVAHYTTPTNIGLFLTTILSAYDLGFLGLSELAIRVRSTFETMIRLEHYRGHLLNWYDTQTLAAIPPRYISTVDSGNLAACLITLKQGCMAMKNELLVGFKQWQGLLALIDILSEIIQIVEKDNQKANTESFEVELTNIYERIRSIENQPDLWLPTLSWLSTDGWGTVSIHLLDLLERHPNIKNESLIELQLYLDLFHHQLQDMGRNLVFFSPWLKWIGSTILQSPLGTSFLTSLPSELPTIGNAKAIYAQIQKSLKHLIEETQDVEVQNWCQELAVDLMEAENAAAKLLDEFEELADQLNASMNSMDFSFLFNKQRQVFHIGYNIKTEQLDSSYYDLLASEARIASLIAIAKGDVPQSHWQHLGRPVTSMNGKQVLLSWSGTMFEYLMPALFIRNYTGTFLSDSCYNAIDAQIEYGREKQIPWGASESGYYAFDVNKNYQYRAFGVPSLGYKRGLSDDLVITPYASVIGLSLQPQFALQNMKHLEDMKMLGPFGFYEALDFTKTRLKNNQTHAYVYSYMAHHQGMILLSACNYLLDDVMVERFHADEHIKSIELLLQENIPQNSLFEFPHSVESSVESAQLSKNNHSIKSLPWHVPIETPFPQVHVLSHGDTSVIVTNAGSGYSQWREFALTRWQADSTLDNWGTWIYVKDLDSGDLWSATSQPMGSPPEKQDVLFYPHKVDFHRSDHGISLQTGICVSVDGVEIRRVNISNESDIPRRLKIFSYGEVVLAKQIADWHHPAFNKLFIESEYLPKENALLFERRLRSVEDKPVVMIHAILIEANRKVTGEHESDRAQFIGRTRTIRNPSALHAVNHHLSGTTGGTLDPIFSLAQEINLKPHAKTRVTFLTLAAPTRTEALEKLSHYQTGQSIYRAFHNTFTRNESELLKLGLNSYAVENLQRLLSALLYPVGLLRAAPHILAQNNKGQPGLWAFGISGDFPILLLSIRDSETKLLTEVLQAFSYWKKRHITINLVIMNESDTGYTLELQNSVLRQITLMGVGECINQHDGIFVLRADQLQTVDKNLFQTVAGVILDEKNGSLAEQVSQLFNLQTYLPNFTPSLFSQQDAEPTQSLSIPADLLMQNGIGGFSKDGSEYVIHLAPGKTTPHPWVNVIANPQFGFLVSEAGSGSTWAVNSGENRLTPWRNDPICDQPGEAVYLRDEETGIVWSPTLLPAGAETDHIIRHGAGYSIFESQSHGLYQNMRMFTMTEEPVKIVQIRLQNKWTRSRRISVTYYVEWMLGKTRDVHQLHILPEFNAEKHALLASNHYNSEFGERVAFLASNKDPHGVTTDRTEFLGRYGSMRAPAALGRIGLASSVHAGVDPCSVIQLHIDLAPNATEEVYFLIGQGANRDETLKLIERMQVDGQVEATFRDVQEQWDKILNCIKVDTPDPAMDLMLNRWLLYQTISCRLWGRSALYQSSGAFGFRDQLQDVLALIHTRPDLVKEQILESAKHQFEAGDVLHWWNPPVGRGVRTRFSDDLLWLPYVTAEYVAATGDVSILNINLPFLIGEPLKPTEIERYAQYEATNERYSLYEHCRRAVDKGLTKGVHSLPLMGTGDWNDGMNRVGMEGRGESIWLGWFLHSTLKKMTLLTTLMMDDPQYYEQQAKNLSQALETHGWDGEWYLRAFYDDGSRMGSHENTECKIDSIAQSWAVLSGAADPGRAILAMDSVNRLLVRPEEQMILLFAPPFDNSEHDPGYIKGYLPGVRENGGQYTHAAIWTAWAIAKLGYRERASELFGFLNPISHSNTPEKVLQYKVEPYVISADIYRLTSRLGQGGWSWYTGSSGWMYRFGLEAILGISLVCVNSSQNLVNKFIDINPCIPRDWPGFKVSYRFGTSLYKIEVSQVRLSTSDEDQTKNNQNIRQVLLDGILIPNGRVPLIDDSQQHEVFLKLCFANSTP